ncbi:MAG: FAD-binding protein [Planctomycetaceae bacterium]|nr:FAD-binding protein [Planctomycetaceae bacterium]
MDLSSSRLYEDLVDTFRGELLIDPVALAAYACDGSLFEQRPFAVACPRDVVDVATVVRYAAEHGLTVIPRGAGTGTAGGALGHGVVVDLSRFLREIGPIVNGTIRVETGVVLDELNRHLRRQGWMFGPHPLATTTTIGGMLAVNARGARSLALGSMRDAVISIDMITADGRFVTITDGSRHAGSSLPTEITVPALRLLDDQRCTHNGCGDHWSGIATDDVIHWPRLLVGSEGSFGIFTAATLRLQRLPVCRGAVLLAFRSLEAAIAAVADLAALPITACDLFDRRLISLARETHSPWADLFSPDAEAALLIEWFADSETQRSDTLNQVLGVAAHSGTAVQVCRVALEDAEVETLWTMPGSLLAMLSRLPGTTRPLMILADLTVPVEHLETAVVQIQRVLQHHGLTAALHAHAAIGSLHFRPLAPIPHPESLAMWEAVTRDISAVVIALGGRCGGSRGAGMAWSQSGGQRAVDEAIHDIFDPRGIFHPGKRTTPAAGFPVDQFRQPTSVTVQPLLLNWIDSQGSPQLLDRCNGCGQCRTTAPAERMCPFFRETHDELASPRAKANAIRQLGAMPADVDAWETPSGKRLLETCFNCKQCETECPSGVDIPRVMIEAKAQRVATHGLSRALWYLTRIPDWMPWLRYGAIALRPFLRRAWFRWLVERVTSITRHRRFPVWRTKPFLQTAPRSWRSAPSILNDNVVVLFIDHVANWHEPEIALAAGRVLEHHGFQVHVPTDQLRAGMDIITCGDLERAKALAEKNIAVLGEFARAGCPIVCTEPSAALCLKVEYPRLLDHPDAALVARAADDIGHFLQRLHGQKRFRTDFQPRAVRAAYHQPCHLRALGQSAPLQELCSLIPGVVTPKIEAGCSGMAGPFGWAKETYEQSVALGQPVARAWESVAATVALSECSSCRQQLEHLTHRRAQHPLLLLAEAYGLTPATSPST